MGALPDLITVEQYRQLPNDRGCKYELHYGEVVPVSFPKQWHILIQAILLRLLAPKLPGFVLVSEYPFRAVPEFDLRAADVAAIRRERFRAVDRKDNLRGAPELVIEVKSPSNTKRELQEKASLCLLNGTIEFWIIEDEPNSVTTIQRDGSRRTYATGDAIPLKEFGGDSLDVGEIFADIE
jgi:Uma2 family endonuclease